MCLKVGDKVKVIKMLRPSESFEIGEVGKVVGKYEYCNNYLISVRMDKDKEVIDFSSEELELYKEEEMKFKIGDKVKVINNTGDNFEGVKVGDVGEVADIGNKSYDYDVYLKINKHTLYGFKQEELELYK